MRRTAVAAIAGAGVLSMMAALVTPAGSLGVRGLPALRALASGGLSVRHHPPARPLPRVLYGVTADDVTSLAELVASARKLPDRPTTRIYFDVSEPPAYYAAAVRRLRPVSYLMGELLDSSDEKRISVAAYRHRVQAYLAAFGNEIDLWEIGNEVNGNWTGRYPTVAKKLMGAYREVAAAGKRTALTLYYNAGCDDGAAELSPLAFSRRYVPPAIRNGLTHVFLSYYEGDCHGLRPAVRTWQGYFQKLHALYPNALVGFGEIGLSNPVTRHTIAAARSLIRYYYGLRIRLPYFVGGYFWWYYAEDCLPYNSKPLWPTLRAGFRAEAASLR
jgi:hypothetical protein